MDEAIFYQKLLLSWFILSGVTFFILFFIAAPYGRLSKNSWGPKMQDRLGWMIMEAPAALGFALFLLLSKNKISPATWIFFGLWETHYIYRAFIYPYHQRRRGGLIPFALIILGLFFNIGNSYLNGRYLFTFSSVYPFSWLWDPRFLVGLFLFLGGMAINRQSDQILRNLRQPGETGYQIPYGGFFHWVSCPNYLGEILQWFGWAIATWSLPGLAFALWTFANLAPRARSYHRWYLNNFNDYPDGRTPLIPKLHL